MGDLVALARTLRTLVSRCHLPEGALPALPGNVARVLNLPAKGRLTAGIDADLVLLAADGLVCGVMAQGRRQVRDGCLVRRGTFEGVEA